MKKKEDSTEVKGYVPPKVKVYYLTITHPFIQESEYPKDNGFPGWTEDLDVESWQ